MAVSLSVANSNTKTLILTNSSSNHYKQSAKASPWPSGRSIMGWKPTVLLLLFKTKTMAQLVVACRMKNIILAVLLTVSFQEQDHAWLSSWLTFVRFHWGYSLSWFVGNKKKVYCSFVNPQDFYGHGLVDGRSYDSFSSVLLSFFRLRP